MTRPGEHAGAEADAAVTDRARLRARRAHRRLRAGRARSGERSVGVVARRLAGPPRRRGRAGGARRCGALDDAPGRPLTSGPCIRAGCYEFDGPERDALADRFGDGVRATTTWGTPALDLPAGVRAALAEAGVTEVARRLRAAPPATAAGTATGRAARLERFATTAWLEEP